MNRILAKSLKDTRAELERDLAPLQEQVAVTQRMVREIQEAISEIDRMLSEGNSSRHRPVEGVRLPTGDGSKASQGSASVRNGLPKGVTRRQVVRRIVPEFDGEPFTAGEVRSKYLKRYPGDDSPNLIQAISNLLQIMAEKEDTIEKVGRKGDGPTDPWLYKENQDREERLIG